MSSALMETWALDGAGYSTVASAERYTRQDYPLKLCGSTSLERSELQRTKFDTCVQQAAKLPSYADRQSPRNLQKMRVFTTLSLAHSDGYINVHQSRSGSHYYDFWDAPLGRPIGVKGQR